MRVPFLDLPRQYRDLKDEIDAAVNKVIQSGHFIMGPEVGRFEEEGARYLDTKHAVSVSSGTAALTIALRALGVKHGDFVMTTPFTFFATVEAIYHAGAWPIFADIDPKTFNMDPDALARTLSKKKEIKDSRIVPCEILSRAMARAPKKPRLFVSASAIGLYGPVDDGECDESHPPGADFLARVCVDWEAAAEPARAAGVRVVTPRIGIVFGKGGGPLAKMIQPFRAMAGGPLGSGRQIVSWVHLEDIVRAFLFLMDGDHSGPFNIVAPSAVTSSELASAIGRAMHRPSLLRTPGFAIELALGAERAQIVLRGQRAVPKRLLAAGFEFYFPTIDVALGDLL